MSAIELKTDIHKYLDQVDETFLKVIHSMLNTYVEEKKQEGVILGYDINGNPRYVKDMKKIYEREIKVAIENDEYINLEDLEKELED